MSLSKLETVARLLAQFDGESNVYLSAPAYYDQAVLILEKLGEFDEPK